MKRADQRRSTRHAGPTSRRTCHTAPRVAIGTDDIRHAHGASGERRRPSCRSSRRTRSLRDARGGTPGRPPETDRPATGVRPNTPRTGPGRGRTSAAEGSTPLGRRSRCLQRPTARADESSTRKAPLSMSRRPPDGKTEAIPDRRWILSGIERVSGHRAPLPGGEDLHTQVLAAIARPGRGTSPAATPRRRPAHGAGIPFLASASPPASATTPRHGAGSGPSPWC
jgi:hypothetical protein